MHTIALSNAALALFRLHLERRGQIDGDANRETYSELERAGLMVAGHSFAGGDESIYRLTKEGFDRKAKLLACTKLGGEPLKRVRQTLGHRALQRPWPFQC